jgi:hypothetical protein
MRHLPLMLLFALPAPAADGLKAGVPGGRSPAAALVEQLGDRDFRTREAAGKKLLELGERAVSALEGGLDSPVPEVARRCEDLLAAVRHKVEADALLAPTMVELPTGDTTLQKALDSLGKQSGYTLRVEGDQAVLSQTMKLAGGKVPFWEAVQTVCAAARLEVCNTEGALGPVDPDRGQRAGVVWLCADKRKSRFSVHKAVLIQLLPPSKDELTRHPTTHAPLTVRVFPEPKVRWHRLIEATAVTATDPKGAAVPMALPPPPVPIQYQEELRGFRPVRATPPPVGTPGTTGVMYLTAGADELADLSGVVRFTAWKDGGELAAVKLAGKETSGTADGPHGVRLSVKVVGPIANRTGETVVDVTHRWNPDLVRPDGSAVRADAVWFENVNGKAVPVLPAGGGGPGPNRFGLVFTNDAGEQLNATSSSTRIDTAESGGRTVTMVTVSYTVSGRKGQDAKPVGVAFYGNRVMEVAVPVAAKNLPLTAGTRQPPPANPNPIGD